MKFLVLIFLISRSSVSRWSVHLDGGRLVGGRWSVGWLVGGPWQVVSWSVVLRKPGWRLVVSETRKEAITRIPFKKISNFCCLIFFIDFVLFKWLKMQGELFFLIDLRLFLKSWLMLEHIRMCSIIVTRVTMVLSK